MLCGRSKPEEYVYLLEGENGERYRRRERKRGGGRAFSLNSHKRENISPSTDAGVLANSKELII